MSTCLQETESSCKQVQDRFNQWETRDDLRYPQGDVMNQVARGMISAEWNLGLRNSQKKAFTVDAYNSGCVDPWGCVGSPPGGPDVPGFRCPGKTSTLSPEMQATFAFLNAPMCPDGAEYRPPAYVLKPDAFGPNSVAGWVRQPQTNEYRWQLQAQAMNKELQRSGPSADCR